MVQLEITDIDTDNGKRGQETTEETFIAVATAETRSAQADALREVLATVDAITNTDLGASERESIIPRIVNRDIILPTNIGPGRVAVGSSPDGVKIDSAIETMISDGYSHFVIDDFASLGDSVTVIADRVSEIVEGGVTVHIVSQGIDVDRENADTVLGVLNGLSKPGVELQRRGDIRDIRGWLPETDRAGRPPLGFEKDDGELIPSPQMDEVRAVLSMRLNENISQRKAAKRLGVSPRTINRAMDNLDRYGIEDSADE